MSMKLGGSQQANMMAISTMPSFNYTSHAKDSVAAYSLYRMLDNAVDTVSSASFNGQPSYVLAKTTQPDCFGDEAGIGGGIISGTVGKEVKPTSGSGSIFIGGLSLVQEGDTCTMNNKNTVGKYTIVDACTGEKVKDATDESFWSKPLNHISSLMSEVWNNIKSSPDVITKSSTVKILQELPEESIQAAKEGLMISALLYPHAFGFDPDFVSSTVGVGSKQGASGTSAVNLHNGQGYGALNYDVNPNQISPSEFSVDGNVVYGFILDKPVEGELNRGELTDNSLAGSSLAGTVCMGGVCGAIVKTKADPSQGIPSRKILMIGLGQSIGKGDKINNSSGATVSGSVMKPTEYNTYENIEEIRKQVEKIKPYIN